MGILSRLAGRARPTRIIDLDLANPIPKSWWERFQDDASAGPMALGAERLFWAKPDSVPLDLGMIAGLGVAGIGGGAALSGRLAQLDAAREGAGDLEGEMDALQRMRADLERRRRRQTAYQGGYMSGLEAESEALARDVSLMNDGSRQEAIYLRGRGY